MTRRKPLPAPDPTPEDKVYMKMHGEGLVLVDHEMVHRACKERMDQFDELPAQERLRRKGG